MNLDGRKTGLRGFQPGPTQTGAAQLMNMARGLKFWIYEVEGLYYPCSENKDADQLAVTTKLICVFVFAYAKSGFLTSRLKYPFIMVHTNNTSRKNIVGYTQQVSPCVFRQTNGKLNSYHTQSLLCTQWVHCTFDFLMQTVKTLIRLVRCLGLI